MPILLYFSVIASFVFAFDAQKCPKQCKCKHNFEHVACINKRLQVLPADIPTAVKYLDFTTNLLLKVENSTFQKLQNLEYLALDNNQINAIDLNAFKGLSKLSTLHLSRNHLNESIGNWHESAQALTGLYLSFNRYTKIPEIGLKNLQSINMDGNTINKVEFPSSFTKCTALRKISLQTNAFTNLTSRAFSSLSAIKQLSLKLARNNMTKIDPAAFKSISGALVSLDLSKNTVLNEVSFRDSMKGFQSTKSAIASLELSGMSWKTINADAFTYLNETKLRSLVMAHSVVVSVSPKLFAPLSHLQSLVLPDSQLTEFPILVAPSLLSLNLRANKISALGPHRGSRLFHLKILDVSNNHITSIASDFFADYSALEQLNLGGNKISSDKATFAGLANLRMLLLQANEIRVLAKGIFSGMHLLSQLNVSHNKIVEWDVGVFSNLSTPSLEVLDVSFNNISTFGAAGQKTSLQDIRSLKKLNLVGNPFNCSASIKPLCGFIKDNMKSKTVVFMRLDEYKCVLPAKLKGTKLKDYCIHDNPILLVIRQFETIFVRFSIMTLLVMIGSCSGLIFLGYFYYYNGMSFRKQHYYSSSEKQLIM